MLETLKKISAGRYYYPAILCLILIFTGMRLVHINADAPQDLSISAASYTDEGFKTYEPRNKVLFGDWKWTPEDEYEGWEKKSPITAHQFEWIFRHFGVSFASIRMLSVFYAFFTMIFLFLYLARNFDRLTALVGLILYGTNFFTAMFNRLGLYETHLLCFIMISFFGFSEFFRMYPSRKDTEGSMQYSIKKILVRSLFFILGISSFAAGFYVKRNILMIIPAITPAVLLYICSRFDKSEKFMNRIFIAFTGIFFIVYLLFAHLGQLKVKLAFLLLSYHIFGQPLISFIPFTAFDPIFTSLAKGMYMEFIFLQPFIFFAGMLFSLYTFHRYIGKKRQSAMDLVISSWLVFGFIFTTVLYYNPSRYYLILVIPLIISVSRLIADFGNRDTDAFISEKKLFPHNIMLGIFLFFTVLYTGVVFLVQTVPVSLRNYLTDTLYPAFIKGDMSQAAIIIIIAVALELACIFITVLNRKRFFDLIKHPKFHTILLSLILGLQLFQYGKWFFFHDDNLYTASKELGRELPENAVLAGSWSAGLVVENRFKALILQSLIPYNHNLVNKINYNIEIPVNSLRGNRAIVSYQNNIPLYFAVCRNVIFEKAIADIYKDQFVPGNLVKRLRFGYFRVDIFLMKKYRNKTTDVVNSLFKSFL
jgi:hypothetical protein